METIRQARLSEYSTFQLGGPCRALVSCRTAEEIEETVRKLNDRGEAYVIIGGGSNILFSDEGVDATVVRFEQNEPVLRREGNVVEVCGAVRLDALAARMAREGMDGLTCCTGIPGTVGGAIAGNAGAWGEQIGDRVESALLLDARGHTRKVGVEELAFSYRHSILKETGEIVLSARLRVAPGSAESLLAKREEVLRKRAERHPDLAVEPCIGSFFRNIEPTSAAGQRKAAGWFLEEAGVKEMRVGGARVFERHANIIVKGPGCTAQDVHDLAGLMREAVRGRFGIELVREVRYLGPFRGEANAPANAFY